MVEHSTTPNQIWSIQIDISLSIGRTLCAVYTYGGIRIQSHEIPIIMVLNRYLLRCASDVLA